MSSRFQDRLMKVGKEVNELRSEAEKLRKEVRILKDRLVKCETRSSTRVKTANILLLKRLKRLESRERRKSSTANSSVEKKGRFTITTTK